MDPGQCNAELGVRARATAEGEEAIWEAEEEKIVINKVYQFIIAAVLNAIALANIAPTKKTRKTNSRPDFHDTAWGKMLLDPDTADVTTRAGKKFRRRFRVPFPIFTELVQMCNQEAIFSIKRKSRIPVECKIMACLRVLGRDNCADDITELSGNMIGESTFYTIFKQFVHGMQEKIFPKYVKVLSYFIIFYVYAFIYSMFYRWLREITSRRSSKPTSI